MGKAVFVFDIDGTLADCTHRQHHVDTAGKPKDWDAFFAGIPDDPPVIHVCEVLVALVAYGHQVVFCTGRPERCRYATVDWINKWVINYRGEWLYMRKDGDHRPDHVVKLELLHEMRRDELEPVMMFDDRQTVVDMWRANGVPCAQVAPGRF